MFRSIFILSLILVLSSHIYGQTFEISTIPEELAVGAKAVVRLDQTHLHLQDYDKLKGYRNVVITIFKPEGDFYNYLPMHYDEHTRLIKYAGEVFDANGRSIKKFRKKDFEDLSAVPNGTLYSENRVKLYEYIATEYPYTIHLSYEYETGNTAFIPIWNPINKHDISVEKGEYKFTNDSNVDLNVLEENFEKYSNLSKENSGNIIKYSIQNIPPVKDEILSPPLSLNTPKAFITLNRFKLAGAEGSFTTWEEFGQWMYKDLIQNRQSLPQDDLQNIAELTAILDNDIEKVKVLYQYMQDKTRYINVAIGIGGWQPYSATYVSEKGYGDCKALSNYMMSILKAANIPSNYTIVYGDRDEKRNIKPDYPSMQGNHVILQVPLENDTIWLECTSQRTGFNHLGNFTNDRYALAINASGGTIVKTQTYAVQNNKDEIDGTGTITSSGALELNFSRKLSGLQYDWGYGISYLEKHDQLKALYNWYDEIKNVKFSSFEFINDKDKVEFTQNIQLVADNYGQINKNNLIFPIVPIDRSQTTLKKDSSRKQPLLIKNGITDNYHFIISIPKSYALNYTIKPKIFDSKFGSYSLQVEENVNGDLLVERKLMIKEGTFPKEEYNAYVKFKKRIEKADNTKVLLEKKN